jgi:hypothetical protein
MRGAATRRPPRVRTSCDGRPSEKPSCPSPGAGASSLPQARACERDFRVRRAERVEWCVVGVRSVESSRGGGIRAPDLPNVGSQVRGSESAPGITSFYAVVTVTSDGTSAPAREVSVTIPLPGATGSRFAATPDGRGWWVVHPDGGIFSYGTAAFYGSLGDILQTSPVVGMASLTGGGYQLIHSDGSATRFVS